MSVMQIIALLGALDTAVKTIVENVRLMEADGQLTPEEVAQIKAVNAMQHQAWDERIEEIKARRTG